MRGLYGAGRCVSERLHRVDGQAVLGLRVDARVEGQRVHARTYAARCSGCVRDSVGAGSAMVNA